jgi:hypothetical protein
VILDEHVAYVFRIGETSLKMEAENSSGNSVNVYRTAQH